MIVNEGLDVDFSLIIPTRERIPFLERCLTSFFNKASRRHNNEAILIVDNCDTSMRNFGDFITQNQMNVKILQVWRSPMMVRDYNNYGAQCSVGKYVWMLNDDYEMVTDNWDAILKTKIESFCGSNNDRCAYVMVDDSTHTNWNIMGNSGCCCPVLTRESVEVMNGVMPHQINSWGADIALFQIFRNLPKPRIIDAVKDIKVLHHCRHNGTAQADEVSRRIERISNQGRGGIGGPERQHYIDRLTTIIS